MDYHIFDASGLIALLKEEAGAAVAREALVAEHVSCLIHAINLCEVYYDFLRCGQQTKGQELIQDVEQMRISIRTDMDPEFWMQVGRLKARHRISLADCFCAALACRTQGAVLTTDRGDFEPLQSAGVCKMVLLR